MDVFCLLVIPGLAVMAGLKLLYEAIVHIVGAYDISELEDWLYVGVAIFGVIGSVYMLKISVGLYLRL